MISYAQALDAIAGLDLTPSSALRSLADAVGQVLAQDVALATDLPPFDRSAMDGFAIYAQADRVTYSLSGTVAAGAAWAGAFPPGSCVRIMTGATVPAGATVVPWERARENAGEVTVHDAADLAPGRNIARRGEDGRAGSVVIARGTVMSPVLIAMVATVGIQAVRVHIPPTLAVITTGDELGTAIQDSNGPLLAALAAAWHCPATADHAGDTCAALAAAMSRAATAQVVVTTGGVGGSERDLVVPVATAAGFVTIFHEVAMQPGKPVLLMRHPDGRFLVGLPGNPVSVLATAQLILQPLLVRLGAAVGASWLTMPIVHAHQARGKRLLFQPARWLDAGIEVVPWNGSGDWCAAAAADGLVEVPIGAAWQVGDAVRFLPYAGSVRGQRGVLPR